MRNRIVYIFIGVLLILNVKLSFDISGVRQEVSNVNMAVQNLGMNVNNIQANVSNSVQSIANEKKWLYNVNYSVTDLSKDFKKVSVALKWNLRELNKDSKVYLLYGVQEEKSGQVSKWNEVLAKDLGNLNYGYQLILPYQNNYQFKVLAKSSKDVICEELTSMNFLSELNDRFNVIANPTQKTASNNHVTLSYSVSVNNNYRLNLENYTTNIYDNLLKIKNMTIRILSNNVAKKEIQIIRNGKLIDKNAQYEEPFKHERDMKLEQITYNSNIEYDTEVNSIEEIEVIIEDNMGKTYISRGHGI